MLGPPGPDLEGSPRPRGRFRTLVTRQAATGADGVTGSRADLRPGRISAGRIGSIDEACTVRKKGDIRTVTHHRTRKPMTKSPLKRVAPATVNRTVTMPRRKPNSVYRTREHLTGAEVDRLIDAAKANRWGDRDATMILVAFRHGLRSSELVDLRWDQIDFSHAVLHVRRAKKGTLATLPVSAMKCGHCASCSGSRIPSRRSFSPASGDRRSRRQVLRADMVGRAGVEAKLGFPADPHMLRHACGFALAEQGPRYASVAGLPWPPQHPAHGAIHRVVAGQVEGLLEMTKFVWLTVVTAWALQRGAGDFFAA